MPIPTFDQMLHPILELSTREPVTRRAATEAMIRHFALTTEETEQRIPSGASTVVGNRAGWAMTFLTKAGLIEKVAPKTYRATKNAEPFLKAHQQSITVPDLQALKGFEEAWEAGRARRRENAKKDEADKPTPADATSTPQEIIAREVASLRSDLRERLLQTIVEQSPAFFERLVLDVLTAMGYGGSREDAAEHVGRSGDEGIDGRINQDSLGLDQVLVQAKRYRPDRPVDRQQIQAFIGSLAGQGVTKGVFITTSSFVTSGKFEHAAVATGFRQRLGGGRCASTPFRDALLSAFRSTFPARQPLTEAWEPECSTDFMPSD
jgi:restriction system protein